MNTINNYSLDQFPHEVLLNIFLYGSDNIKTINRVCKNFNKIAEDILLKTKFLNDANIKLMKSLDSIVIFPYQRTQVSNFYKYISTVLSGKFAWSDTKVLLEKSNTYLDRHLIDGKIYSYAESVKKDKGTIHIYHCNHNSSEEIKFKHEDKGRRICFSPQRQIDHSLYLTGRCFDLKFDDWVHDESIYVIKLPETNDQSSSKKHKSSRIYMEAKNVQKFKLPESIHQVVYISKDYYLGLNITKGLLELCPWSQETYAFNIPGIVDFKAADDVIILQIVQNNKSYYQWFNIQDIKVDQIEKSAVVENLITVDLLNIDDFPTNDPNYIRSLKLVGFKKNILFLDGMDSIYVIDLKENRLTSTVCYKNNMQTVDKISYKELTASISLIKDNNIQHQKIVKICKDKLLPQIAYQWPLLIISPPGYGYLQFYHVENHTWTRSEFMSNPSFEIYQSQLYRYNATFDKTQILVNQLWIQQENVTNGKSNKK